MVKFGSSSEQTPQLKIAGEPGLVKLFSGVINKMQGADPNETASHLAALILGYAVKEAVSDIHFDMQRSFVNLRFRIDGRLKDVLTYPKNEFPITARIRVMADFPPQAASAYKAEDGRFQVNVDGHIVQFRVSSFPTIFGDKLVLRVLDMGKNTLDLAALGMSEDTYNKVRALSYAPGGMFIVTGLTGCGKTTTICSILNMRRTEEINIMTIEDPVEYVLPGVTHSQINKSAGFTFAQGLRSILRQDPNILMVGEIRDEETADVAMHAAMTGHSVFSTVHASSSTGVIHRILNMNVDPYIVAASIRGVLSQRLIRKLCPDCAKPAEPDVKFICSLARKDDKEYIKKISDMLNAPGGNYKKAVGCPKCRNTGYLGRTGIFELVVPDDDFRNFIAAKGDMTMAQIRQMTSKITSETLLMDAINKFRGGITAQDEIGRVSVETF